MPLNMLRKENQARILDATTVIVRVHDNQREKMIPKGYYGDIDNSYLP